MGPSTLSPPESYNCNKVIGFKGFEALAFVVIIVVLLMVSTLTSFTNLMIIYKLRLFPNMELIGFSEDNGVIFNHKADLNRVHLHTNEILGVSKLIGNVSLEVGQSHVSLDSTGLEIKSKDGFKVYSRKSGQLLFPVDFSKFPLPPVSALSIPGGIKNVHKIRSPTDQDLGIQSESSIRISGNEGLYVDSKSILLDGLHLSLSSQNGSIIFEGEQSISINPGRMLISSVANTEEDQQQPEPKNPASLQYKLCICGKTGRLFRIKIKSSDQGCADVRFPESGNPCS